MCKNELTSIPGYPGYSITHDGRVQTDKTGLWRKVHISKNTGYATVGLYRDGEMHLVTIHRLLLETFVGPCPLGMECRHLDSDKSNNNLNNLVWNTHYRNTEDRTLRGTFVGNRKLSGYKVSWIKQLLDAGRFTHRRIARVFGVSKPTVESIRYGKTWAEVV